jgi:hypothetical protein
LVSGKLSIHPDGYSKAQTAVLSNALFYSGDIAIDIIEAVIRVDQISGWGEGEPSFIDREE